MLHKNNIIPDLDSIKSQWKNTINEVLEMANLSLPDNNWKFEGGRQGRHSEHMGYLLADLQYMQRTYPNMEW